MKKEIILSIMIGLSTLSSATTRADVQIIESSENIRFLSQNISSNYLLLFTNKNNLFAKKEIKQSILKLTREFRNVAMTSKDTDTKDILEFLTYSKTEMQDLLNKKVDSENASLLLDFTETFLEGANSIEKDALYEFSSEEKMLSLTKNMQYLLERTYKYYLAYHLGFNKEVNLNGLKNSIIAFDKHQLLVNAYDYPYEHKKIASLANIEWKTNKIILEKGDKLFIPNILNDLIASQKESLISLSKYHTKNQ